MSPVIFMIQTDSNASNVVAGARMGRAVFLADMFDSWLTLTLHCPTAINLSVVH